MDNNGKFLISMYHYTRDLKHSRYPEIKGLDVGLFRKQMEFLGITAMLYVWNR